MFFQTEPSVDPPEDVAICECTKCHGDIYEGEIYGTDGHETICTDCIEQMWNELTNEEKFGLFNLDVVHAEKSAFVLEA